MSVSVGYSAGVLMGGYDMTAYLTNFSVNATQDMLEGTTFGSNGSRTKYPGLRHATLTGDGFYDNTITVGSWDVLTSQWGTGTPIAVSFAPQGFTLGNRVLMIYSDQIKFDVKQVIADLIKLTVGGEAEEDGLDAGISLHALSAETSFPFTGTAVDNTAATTNGGAGVVHVTAIAGAAKSVTYKIQHSTDNSTWVDLIATFTAITSANSVQRVEVAAGTTIRRYLKIIITDNGTTSSVTGIVAFARR